MCGTASVASAAYDIDTLGIPKFVNTNYIDLTKIDRISRFRSMVGHNYSDSTQFGLDAVRDARGIENCRSMKHYFMTPDSTVSIFAPVAGTVTSIRVGVLGDTVEIRADAQPDFNFGIFHVKLARPLAIGEHVAEGQHLGSHTGSDTWSDISVWVQTPRGKHLISYFETLTEAAFAPYKARGIASIEPLVRSRADRDADPNVCSFNNAPAADIVAMVGTPATQVLTLTSAGGNVMRIGDAPLAISGTSSLGLPVTVVSATPKVCTAENNTVTARRPGLCKALLTQPGNATTYEARPVAVRINVLQPDAAADARPRLVTVFPAIGNGRDSYLRFFNTGSAAGTVTASLIDGSSGQTVVKWTSPLIAPGAAPQYPVSVLEAAAPTGLARRGLYSLRIEPETTIDGFLQHVIYDAGLEILTNASTCDTGTTASPHRLMNVHTSRLDAGYPSTIILNNIGATAAGMGLTMRDASDGVIAGRFYSSSLPPAAGTVPVPNTQIVLNEAIMETLVQPVSNPSVRVNISPVAAYHFNMIDENAAANSSDSPISRYYYQHLVTNKRAGVIADMSTVCALNGRSNATANAELRLGSIYSSLQAQAQSVLRFYNSGTTAGPVTVDLYGNNDDQPLGSWISPPIAPGSMQEYPIATIERELKLHQTDFYIPPALVKQNIYGLRVRTEIDGYMQHILRRTQDGAFSNLSTCADAVTTAPKTLMAVLSSVMDAEGYVSTITVANTGATSASARLTLYDARHGMPLGAYQTEPIAANGFVYLDVRSVEAAARISPDATLKQYVVKTEEPFSGFLQHIVHNKSYGAVLDMTAACML
ncbi:MAG: hypothetical protein JNK21_04300 [Rhodospirillaceae bacterium]|nr:hypothetical protein [Rhodospirillaceae bacterium]